MEQLNKLLEKGLKLLKKEKYEKAVNIFNQISEGTQNIELALRYLAYAYTKLRYFDKALEYTNRALKFNKSEFCINILFYIHDQLGNFDEMMKIFNEYLEDHPNLNDLNVMESNLLNGHRIENYNDTHGLGDIRARIINDFKNGYIIEYYTGNKFSITDDLKKSRVLSVKAMSEIFVENNIQFHIFTAFRYANIKTSDKINELMNLLLKRFPEHSGAWEHLICLYQDTNKQIEEKIAHASNAQDMAELERIHQELFDIYEKILTNEKVVLKNRDILHNILKLGRYYLDNEKYDTFLNVCNKFLKFFENNKSIWNYLGFLHHKLENYDTAIENFKKALEIESEFINAWNNIGNSFLKKGNMKNAEKAYKRALEINPRDVTSLASLSIIYNLKKDHLKAIEIGKQALEIDPKDSVLLCNLGHFYYQHGDFKKGIEYCNKALEIDPTVITAWNILAYIYNDMKYHDKSLKALNNAAEIDPSDKIVWNNYAWTYNNLNQYDNAIEACQRALKLDPDFAQPYNHLGYAHFKKGDIEKAVENIRKSIDLDPTYARPPYYLAKIYFELQKYENALEQINNCLKIDPNFEDADKFRSTILKKKEKKANIL
ncbi:MAG: tetratricopeptide repeat protein [Promethearchaeota archaeon]